MVNYKIFLIMIKNFVFYLQAQYDDKRCICICPDPSVVNGTKSNRKIYKSTVPPNKW